MQISASISLVTLGNTELCCCAIFISLLYMKVASARLIINPYRLAPLLVLNMPSKTFTPPYHLDSDLLTFPDVWDHAAEHSPDHPVFTYHDGDACDVPLAGGSWAAADCVVHSIYMVSLRRKGIRVHTPDMKLLRRSTGCPTWSCSILCATMLS